MDNNDKQILIDKLSYISKSKKSAFDKCPMAFKLSYIDKIPQGENPYFIIGTDVHEFIENFFKIMTIQDNELYGLNILRFHPNTEYKKNVAKFEMERFEIIKKLNLDKSFFFPLFNEKQWITENPKLIGVVDRIHKCCKEDPLAPKHPDFKDGDLVIVENKTGKPTFEKCKGYEEDLLWYKIICEIKHPELAPLKWGTIYFPFDNHPHFIMLKDEDCRELAKKIKITREEIIECIQTEKWNYTKELKNCKNCNVKNNCEMNKHV